MRISQKIPALFLLSVFTLAAEAGNKATTASELPRVKLQTNFGDIIIELYPDKAPITVKNFLRYIKEGFYDGTLFHRVIDDFMIQGGGFNTDFELKPTHAPIRNEADNGLENEAGTIAMARTADPHSATSQFFINLTDNPFLNFRSKDPRGWGYAVFGRVIEGMDVVKAISEVETGHYQGHANVPVEPVIIKNATVVTE